MSLTSKYWYLILILVIFLTLRCSLITTPVKVGVDTTLTAANTGVKVTKKAATTTINATRWLTKSGFNLLLWPLGIPLKHKTEEEGLASWYIEEGSETASGERYDRNKYTAGHPTLPFDSYVEITNLENGRTVVVKINDRGPKVKGRIIDLSYAAARDLSMLEKGEAKVHIKVLKMPAGAQK